DYYVSPMAQLLNVAPARIDVVPLGINLDGDPSTRSARSGQAPATPSDDLFRVGYFARIAPEKGLHLLAEAYPIFRKRTGNAPVRFDAAGYMSRARESYLDTIKNGLATAGVGDEFTYHGAVDRAGKLSFLRTLGVVLGATPLRR